MENFTFHQPTEFIFGKDAELQVATMCKKYGAKKILIHYGGGSVVKSGLLQRVEDELTKEGLPYIKLGGARPNPIDTLVYEGIALCKQENIDFVLAIGGGSAIDSAKAIAAGAKYDGDFWDFFGGEIVTDALKVATILTIPAAGSEASAVTVITNTAKGKGAFLKKGARGPALKPVFSLLNPELNYTLPAYQTACGAADIMAHVFERYFTNTENVEISSNLCEAILSTVIKETPIAINEPTNYGARANLTWAGAIAHNGTCGVGRAECWASHKLEHELSALYDVAHGAGLAVILPAWMKYVYRDNPDYFVRLAINVWGIANTGTKEEIVLKGIKALEDFFVSIGLPITFEELGAKKEDIPTLVKVLEMNVGETFGGFKKLTLEDAVKIYELACQ